MNAHVLAVTKLLSVRDDKVKDTAPCGKAYSISDGTPIDNFEFFRPLCLARKAEFPSVTIPTFLASIIALICEIVYLFFSSIPPFLHIEPFMTRSEVHKVRKDASSKGDHVVICISVFNYLGRCNSLLFHC